MSILGRLICVVMACTLALPMTPLHAAPPAATASPSAAGDDRFDAQQLDALLAPIALYPDSLLMQLLMASTFPLQVVEASRWVEDAAHKDLKGDALTKALASVSWDPSVKSLVPFPQVLAQMDGNLEWLQQLGFAFAEQQQDVLNSIQRLRTQAQQNGKLQSSPQQVVQSQPHPSGQSTIVIQPTQPNVVYVPSYDPSAVYGAWPYPSYPPVTLPPPPGYAIGSALIGGLAFGTGVAIASGLWGWASPNWGGGNVNVNVNRWNNINVNRQQIRSNVWQASNRPGGLPPTLRRPPAGPVGRPSRSSGLPANAIGRPSVNVPGDLVSRPARPAGGDRFAGNRPNLAPGSRPNVGGGDRAGLGGRGGTQAGVAARPHPAPREGPRPSAQRPQRGSAFEGVGQGQRAQQFGQRGQQSRQSNFAGTRDGGGGHARAGGGLRGRH